MAFELAINSLSIDRNSRRAVPSGQETNAGFVQKRAHAVSREMLPDWDRNSLQILTGIITLVPPIQKRVSIEPLRNSPRYHLVYEIDEERWFVPPESQDMSASGQEAREKNEAYNV